MPVRKFRSSEEMDENAWRAPGDPDLFRAIRSVSGFAQRTVRPSFPPGVYKHRSAADADALRAVWEEKNLRALRERRENRTR